MSAENRIIPYAQLYGEKRAEVIERATGSRGEIPLEVPLEVLQEQLPRRGYQVREVEPGEIGRRFRVERPDQFPDDILCTLGEMPGVGLCVSEKSEERLMAVFSSASDNET